MSTTAFDLDLFRSDLREFGFAAADNWLDADVFRSLRAESLAQRDSARSVSDDGEISYRGYLADLGNVALSFLTSSAIAEFLRAAFDEAFTLARGSSCYTYYEAGNYLSAHKDGAEDCAVTILVYLDAASPDPGAATSGLSLELFDDRAGRPGDVIHAIATRSGLLVAGRGSRVWHGRPPLADGEHVYLLTACFSAAG